MTLVGYPVAVSLTTDASLWAGMGVQSLVLVPAVIFAPTIHQGKSPYALMWVSMIMLIYLGCIRCIDITSYLRTIAKGSCGSRINRVFVATYYQ